VGCVSPPRGAPATEQGRRERPPLRILQGRKVACFEAEKITL